MSPPQYNMPISGARYIKLSPIFLHEEILPYSEYKHWVSVEDSTKVDEIIEGDK